jgi:hypothetical protein
MAAWQTWVNHRSIPGGMRWADYFEIYPWGPGKDGALTGWGPESHANIQEATEFKGQVSPLIGLNSFIRPDLDIAALEVLLLRWQRLHVARKRAGNEVRLFRSLGVAVEASRVPFEIDFHLFEVGTRLSLWVSAIEVLFNPQQNNQKEVLKRLDGIQWTRGDFAHHRHYLLNRSGKADRNAGRVGVLHRLYSDLFRARNDFLHGNVIRGKRLFVLGDRRQARLLEVAPLLYRVLLMVYLGKYVSVDRARQMSRSAERRYHLLHNSFEEEIYDACCRRAPN